MVTQTRAVSTEHRNVWNSVSTPEVYVPLIMVRPDRPMAQPAAYEQPIVRRYYEDTCTAADF